MSIMCTIDHGEKNERPLILGTSICQWKLALTDLGKPMNLY
jgi:hypothetical protein